MVIKTEQRRIGKGGSFIFHSQKESNDVTKATQ